MGTPVATPVYPTVLKLPGQIPALQHRGSWTQQRRHPPYHHHLPAFSLSLSLSLSHSLSLSLSLSLSRFLFIVLSLCSLPRPGSLINSVSSPRPLRIHT